MGQNWRTVVSAAVCPAVHSLNTSRGFCTRDSSSLSCSMCSLYGGTTLVWPPHSANTTTPQPTYLQIGFIPASFGQFPHVSFAAGLSIFAEIDRVAIANRQESSPSV